MNTLLNSRESRVLIVEDEIVNQEMITFSLQQIRDFDMEIDRTVDGDSALKFALENEYDAILLDIFIEGSMDGFDVLKRLRESEKCRTTPILVITSDVDLKHKALKLQATDFISKPFDLEALQLRVKNYIHHNHTLKQLRRRSTSLEKELQQKVIELKESLTVAKETEYEISLRLAKASEFRDVETGMHIKRMSLYSQLLAKLLGFSEEKQELVFRSSPLHDIGKIGILDNILLKPGKLTADEFDIMKRHTTIGGAILDGAEKYPVLKFGKIIAEQHHEKWNGSGYPRGLEGEEIHPFARVVAIADVFDALSSKRVYKPPMNLTKVMEIMREGRGSHFDPDYFDKFEENLYLFLEIKDKHQDTIEEEESPESLDSVRT
jgi:putative two-component system response regulator